MAALDEELAQRERQLSEQLRASQTAAAAQLSDAEVRAGVLYGACECGGGCDADDHGSSDRCSHKMRIRPVEGPRPVLSLGAAPVEELGCILLCSCHRKELAGNVA